MSDPVTIICAVGRVLRSHREDLGLIRRELRARLPGDLHVQTIAHYETGRIVMPLTRYLEICAALNVDPAEILRIAQEYASQDRAQHRRKLGRPPATIYVNLEKLRDDRTPELARLRTWARRKLAHGNGNTIALLHPAAIEEMATILGLTYGRLVQRLERFRV